MPHAVTAEFTRKHTPAPAVSTAGMDLTADPIVRTAVRRDRARAEWRAGLTVAQAEPRARVRARALRNADALEGEYEAAVAQLERAVRAANPDATEAQINTAVRRL